MDYLDDPVQSAFDVMTAVDAVERCATQARLGARQSDELVGIASDSFRDRLAQELRERNEAHTDVSAWLRMRGISVAWVATSAPGATVDEAGSTAEVLEPVDGLKLWPAAEVW
ncbi:hypothetical protein [Streptomyces coeruleorubidus]|uniref:hypothetical protein n=1 Tax=Streptomyces coeruleorubidus TaxID=116188 RepID=UPI0033AD43CA